MMNVRRYYEGPGGVQGNVLTSGDQVALRILGINWASFQFSVIAAGTATVKAEYTTESGPLDGVKNWLAAPYAHRTSVANANPTLAQIKTTTLSLGDVWVIEIPANCQAVRIACDGTGTVSTVLLQPDKPWLPGIPVMAVLYDVTESGVGAGINTGQSPFDVGGWNTLSIAIVSPATNACNIRAMVDDTGTIVPGLTIVGTVSSSSLAHFGRMAPGDGTVSATLTGGEIASLGAMGRRMTWYLAAGGTGTTGRIRVEAYR